MKDGREMYSDAAVLVMGYSGESDRVRLQLLPRADRFQTENRAAGWIVDNSDIAAETVDSGQRADRSRMMGVAALDLSEIENYLDRIGGDRYGGNYISGT